MKNKFIQRISFSATALLLMGNIAFAQTPENSYTPTPENLKVCQKLEDYKSRIVLHQDIYPLERSIFIHTPNLQDSRLSPPSKAKV